MTEVTIRENDAGQSVEKYLGKAFRNLPRSMMFKALRNKKIKVNRKRAQSDQLLREGDVLQLFLPPDMLETDTFVPNDKPLKVIYEDQDILAVFKPAGLLSQKDQPGFQDDLNSRIRTYLWRKGDWDPETDKSFRPSVAHRLDRNTSGIVLAGKSAEGARHLSDLLREGKIEKHYHALVEGRITCRQDVKLYLKKEGTKARISSSQEEGFLPARMTVTPLSEHDGCTWLDINLKTGRFHQIRACMAFLGHPLKGDSKYGGTGTEGYILQAYNVKFDDKSITYENMK